MIRLSEIRKELVGEAVYFDKLGGNHGDTLIRIAAEQLITQWGIHTVNDPDEATVILMNGGGGFGPIHVRSAIQLRYYITTYTDKRIVVLPSSYDEYTMTQCLTATYDHTSSIILMAREKYSFRVLSEVVSSDQVRLGLDEDLAFQLTDCINRLPSKLSRIGERVLLVERTDGEGKGESRIELDDLGAVRSLAQSLLPSKVKRTIKRIWFQTRAHRAINVGSPMRDCLSEARSVWEGSYCRATYCADISRSDVCSFEEFVGLVRGAGGIVTDRLHVAILGALFRRPTMLKEGIYHKNRGVFELSLKKRGVDWCGR